LFFGPTHAAKVRQRSDTKREAGHLGPRDRTAVLGVSEEPREGTIERWAWDYVCSTSLEAKLEPPPRPKSFEPEPQVRRIERPGRPLELIALEGKQKTPRPGALKNPKRRAQVIHTFFHHELQAAELMAWAVLAFPEAPVTFRRGLLKIADDEIAHMGLYAEHLWSLDHPVGSFPVNDWFWSRVPRAATAAHFVATLGMGLEGGNLDHAQRFAERFRAAGDGRAASIQERIAAEEIPHVAFAIHWFEAFIGALDFEDWRLHLVPPLTPMMMRGAELNRAARGAAGFPPLFLDRLSTWTSESRGS
jgi:uncharacterized ferritin-like protein (DUF455 family)